MKSILNKLNLFFFEENNNYVWISFFRISIGSLVLLHFISILPDFNTLFCKEGVIPSDILDTFLPNFVISFPKIIDFLLLIGISQITTILLFKVVFIVIALFVIIGFIPRISAFILLFLQISLVKGSSFYAYGVDYFTSMSLFYLILIPSHYNFSFYSFLKRSINETNITPYRRLFQLHLSIAYFFSGFDKALGFNWWNGESIWKAINLPFANKDFNFDYSFLANHSCLLVIAGWSTIVIEIFYPVFIWIPKFRKFWLFLTISMHIGIALSLNLYIFSAMMIIWNLTNFHHFNKN